MLIFVLYALVLSAVIGLSARAIAQLIKEHKENKGEEHDIKESN